jgi:hypothetical protein
VQRGWEIDWWGGGGWKRKKGAEPRGYGACSLGQFPCERCYTDADDMRIPRPPLPRLPRLILGNALSLKEAAPPCSNRIYQQGPVEKQISSLAARFSDE